MAEVSALAKQIDTFVETGDNVRVYLDDGQVYP
jgi:hypothetical protein